MTAFVRIALRCLWVSVIVISCGAALCAVPQGDVMYAKGYGYIVKVSLQNSVGVENDYYVFRTEEAARAFVEGQKRNLQGWIGGLYDDRRWEDYYADNGDTLEEYEKITRLLEPVPLAPTVDDTTLPLTQPELPSPIPPTPQ